MIVSEGPRGPLFVQGNPSRADLPAGTNAGIQVWVGDNPTATPGAGDAVAATIACIAGNNRDNLWGANIVVGNADLGAGWKDGNLIGLEVNMYSDFPLAETNPFGGTQGRKNLVELVGSGGGGRLTSAAMIWVNDDTGDSWLEHGIAMSRVVQTGIQFVTNPSGGTDGIQAFQKAAIHDASNSNAVIKIDGSHTSFVDLSGNPSITAFVLGKNNANTDVFFTNNANYGMSLVINAGVASPTSPPQMAAIQFADRCMGKWAVLKRPDNAFAIQNIARGTTPLAIDPATDEIRIGGGALFVEAGALKWRGSSGTVTTLAPA